ncbi:MAG: hypothetical protein JSR21_09690 [Proteobacteria bacterium]|nr:hypothetical protein [Pseudomonadota bacterium]
MRALRLARVAAEAEALLLRRRARSAALRGMLAVVALLFLCCAVALLHIAAWLRMSAMWGAETAALALAGFDAAVAIIVGFVSARLPSDRIAAQAAEVRDRAVSEMRASLAVSALLKPALLLALDLLMARRAARRKD